MNELAAINGSVDARHNLGCVESRAGNNLMRAGNNHRAFKHFMLAARAGNKLSLDNGIYARARYKRGIRKLVTRIPKQSR